MQSRPRQAAPTTGTGGRRRVPLPAPTVSGAGPRPRAQGSGFHCHPHPPCSPRGAPAHTRTHTTPHHPAVGVYTLYREPGRTEMHGIEADGKASSSLTLSFLVRRTSSVCKTPTTPARSATPQPAGAPGQARGRPRGGGLSLSCHRPRSRCPRLPAPGTRPAHTTCLLSGCVNKHTTSF